MMVGVLVGLIVGVGVAIGLAFYLNKKTVPFDNLEKLQSRTPVQPEQATELLAPGTRIDAAPPSPPATAIPPVVKPPVVASASVSAPAPAQDDEQRFDFYKILPGQLEAVPVDKTNGTDQAGARPSDVPVKSYLQAGAFNNESDADNMKAKLALMGVESSIQSTQLPGKGLVHRVRIGPFERAADVEALRQRLKQDGIDVAVVKPSPKP